MKFLKDLIITSAALFCAAGTALAGGAAQSFNTTNNLANAVEYANYPTNLTGIATGGAINIDNYNTVGTYFDADVSNNASAVVVIKYVRSHATPTAWASTNSPGTGTTNWETTPVYAWTITVPAMTNHFTAMTNLPNDFAGCARNVGISWLSNSLASGQVIQNLDTGLTKKIIPIVYP